MDSSEDETFRRLTKQSFEYIEHVYREISGPDITDKDIERVLRNYGWTLSEYFAESAIRHLKSYFESIKTSSDID